MVVIDAQFDQLGTVVEECWPLEEHPGLREAVETLQPVASASTATAPGRRCAGWSTPPASPTAPGCPSAPTGRCTASSRSPAGAAAIPKECVDRCVALGHFLELALSNWAAHRTLEVQATVEERRRIARELHDGLAHELAFIASKTRARPQLPARRPHDARELAGRGRPRPGRGPSGHHGPLGQPPPQSLDDAISQTVEDLGSRLGLAWDLELADDIEVPGEVTENLLRIVREAITNAATHGASEHVRVSLERAEQLRLVIEDDGCGFDPGGDRAGGGSGSRACRSGPPRWAPC